MLYRAFWPSLWLAWVMLPMLFYSTKGKVIRYEGSNLQGSWSKWSLWSACTLTTICHGGSRTRQRRCLMRNITVNTCTGTYVELQDCPSSNCKHVKPMIYTDIAEAPMSSFISQECNTDVKYSVASKHSKRIPSVVLSRFKNKLLNFLSGFFNVEYLIGKPEIGLKNMTKVCFEPKELKFKDLPSIYRFNRIVKASLSVEDKLSAVDDVITGVVIVTEDSSGVVQGIYYAMGASDFGYKTVGYRRWRGEGVLDAL